MKVPRGARHVSDSDRRRRDVPTAPVAWARRARRSTARSSTATRFEGREGATFRISLTYDAPTGVGKTTVHTATYHGRFLKLVPNERVVEVVEFETADPAMRGEMTITITLGDANGGTELVAVHDGLPRGLPPADNKAG